MSLRNLLETNFPLNTSEVQPSTEGFKEMLGKIFKKKSTGGSTNNQEDESLTRENHHRFAMDVLLSKDASSLTLVSGDVTLSKKASAYMTRNEKPVSHPINELNKDISEYTRLVSQIKPALNNYRRFLNTVNKETEAFQRKHPGTDNFEELVALTDKLNKLAPKPLSGTFRQPGKGALMGISDPSFVDAGMFETDIAHIYDRVDAITLPPLTHSELKTLQDYLKKLIGINIVLWELDRGKGHSLDITDPPYRGYSDEFLNSDKYADKINTSLFFEPMDKDYFFGIIEPVEAHIENLYNAFVEYAYKSVKHDD